MIDSPHGPVLYGLKKLETATSPIIVDNNHRTYSKRWTLGTDWWGLVCSMLPDKYIPERAESLLSEPRFLRNVERSGVF